MQSSPHTVAVPHSSHIPRSVLQRAHVHTGSNEHAELAPHVALPHSSHIPRSALSINTPLPVPSPCLMLEGIIDLGWISRAVALLAS